MKYSYLVALAFFVVGCGKKPGTVTPSSPFDPRIHTKEMGGPHSWKGTIETFPPPDIPSEKIFDNPIVYVNDSTINFPAWGYPYPQVETLRYSSSNLADSSIGFYAEYRFDFDFIIDSIKYNYHTDSLTYYRYYSRNGHDYVVEVFSK